jgi:predicted NBD/HSP70 family sugar kinase
MDVLVIDIGGSSVKLWHTGHEEHRKFDSGKALTPDAMVEETKKTVQDWKYEAIALGVPSRVSGGRAVEDPPNLGPGWVSYHFSSAFGQPVRIMNDACLQALGSYDGGRMLFLGLGTAVGSALIAEHLVLSLDMGRMRFGGERVFEILGDKGFDELGLKKWQKAVHEIIPSLKHAVMADYIVLGGGNVKEIDELPDGVRRGHNRSVVEGGRRLWEELPDPAEKPSGDWLVL